MTPMQQMLRLMIAAFVAVAFAHFSGAASAQGAVKQIKLTDKHIEGFIAAQKDMAAGRREDAGQLRQARSQGAGRARDHRQEARLRQLRRV